MSTVLDILAVLGIVFIVAVVALPTAVLTLRMRENPTVSRTLRPCTADSLESAFVRLGWEPSRRIDSSDGSRWTVRTGNGALSLLLTHDALVVNGASEAAADALASSLASEKEEHVVASAPL